MSNKRLKIFLYAGFCCRGIELHCRETYLLMKPEAFQKIIALENIDLLKKIILDLIEKSIASGMQNIEDSLDSFNWNSLKVPRGEANSSEVNFDLDVVYAIKNTSLTMDALNISIEWCEPYTFSEESEEITGEFWSVWFPDSTLEITNTFLEAEKLLEEYQKSLANGVLTKDRIEKCVINLELDYQILGPTASKEFKDSVCAYIILYQLPENIGKSIYTVKSQGLYFNPEPESTLHKVIISDEYEECKKIEKMVLKECFKKFKCVKKDVYGYSFLGDLNEITSVLDNFRSY